MSSYFTAAGRHHYTLNEMWIDDVKETYVHAFVLLVSLQDINMRKPFKSSVSKDQQMITVDSRPLAVVVTLQQCDSAPALQKLDVFRWALAVNCSFTAFLSVHIAYVWYSFSAL